MAGLVLISVSWTRAVVTSVAFFFVGLLPVLGIIGSGNVKNYGNPKVTVARIGSGKVSKLGDR